MTKKTTPMMGRRHSGNHLRIMTVTVSPPIRFMTRFSFSIDDLVADGEPHAVVLAIDVFLTSISFF